MTHAVPVGSRAPGGPEEPMIHAQGIPLRLHDRPKPVSLAGLSIPILILTMPSRILDDQRIDS
jgi:hypothetical protein